MCMYICITKEWFGKWLVTSTEDSSQPIMATLHSNWCVHVYPLLIDLLFMSPWRPPY